MSGMTFEALTGVLALDTQKWGSGFDSAGRQLEKFTAATSKELASAATAANMSLSGITEVASKLANTLGTNMASAATLLNDALQNPIKGLDALHAAGLKVTEAQRAEMESFAANGQTLNAHALLIGQITDRYDLLHSSVDDLDFSGWDNFSGDSARLAELTEAEQLTRDIAETDAQIASNYEYEAKLLDDLNHKFAEQADLKARAELYRNIPTSTGGPLTNSEYAASQASSGLSLPSGGAVVGGLALGGVAAAGYSMQQFIASYAEAEDINVRLESVLKATGNAAGFSAEQLGEMANRLEDTTRYAGSSAKEAMILLSTMKEIKGDTFERTMKSAADLAAVMKTDLPSAAETLGRALANPEQASGRLAKAGIFLSEKQKEQIATFMKLNDIASAQKVILDEVASRTGGAAAAAADTLGGKWEQLKTKAGNLGEAIGGMASGPTRMLVDGLSLLTAGATKALSPIDSMTEAWLRSRIEINRLAGDMEKVIELEAELAAMKSPGGEAPSDGDAAKKSGPTEAERARLADQKRRYAASQEEAKLRDEYERKYGLTADDGYANSTERQIANAAKDKQREDRSKDRASQARRAGDIASPSAIDNTQQNNMALAVAGLGPMQSDDGTDARAALAAAGKENVLAMVGSMKAEIASFQSSGDLQFDWKKMTLSDQSQKDLDNILAKYRANVSLMPGYNAEAWAKTEAIVQENLRKAAKSTGEQRALYLQNADNAIKASEKMYEDYFAKMEAAKKKAAEVVDLNPADIAARFGGDLGAVKRDEAVSTFGEMGGEIKSTLAPGADGAIDDQNVQRILKNYKAMLSQMPGFSAPIFAQIEKQVVENAHKAMETTGGMREMYLKRLEQTLADGEKVFEKKAKPPEAKQVDAYAQMQDATKAQLQAQLGSQMQGMQGALQYGMSTEQRQGLKALQNEWAAAMRRVRDSTGEARAANIEEVKRINEAWAKSYQAIRDGSKKTVEQLVGDAKQQGKAGAEGAKERALSNKEKRQNDIAARAANDNLMRGANPMDAIFGMSQGISDMLNGALSGIGSGQLVLAQVMEQTKDPMAKLALESDNLNARLAMATLNAQTFGGSLQLVSDLQNELNGLQKKKMDIERQQQAERKAAEDRRSENYKKREIEKQLRATEERRELGFDLASALTVGSKAGRSPTINIYGTHDAKEIVGKIDQQLKTRGVNRGITKTLDSRGG